MKRAFGAHSPEIQSLVDLVLPQLNSDRPFDIVLFAISFDAFRRLILVLPEILFVLRQLARLQVLQLQCLAILRQPQKCAISVHVLDASVDGVVIFLATDV